MAFQHLDADVAAVFIRRKTGPNSEVLRLLPYLLVTYPDGVSGIEPYPVRPTTGIFQDVIMSDFEVDRIEIYDEQPYHGVTEMGYI